MKEVTRSELERRVEAFMTDENGLPPTVGARQVLAVILDVLDEVDLNYTGHAAPTWPVYSVAVRTTLLKMLVKDREEAK